MASWRSTMAPPSARTAVSPLAVATGCFSAAIRAAKRLRCCEASSRLATAAVLSPSPGSATCCPEFRRTPSRGLVNYCPTAGNRSLVQPRSELRLYHSIHATGMRFTSRLQIGNRFNIRIEGTRIKHTMGPVSIKLYDKFGLILRIETTVNDLTFFKHYREVEHRDGSRQTKWASMQKTIYSLPALRELLEAANRRYLEFLSAIEDPRAGRNKLDKLSQPVEQEGRRYSGFNLFDQNDENLLCAIVRGEFNISGLQNKSLRRHLSEL